MKATHAMTLRIGRRRPIQVADYAEASRIYCELRDQLMVGASKLPEGKIFDANGRPAAKLSYNGRAWNAEGKCVYDPFPDGGMFPVEVVRAAEENGS